MPAGPEVEMPETTAAPQPNKTRENVPNNSAINFFIIVIFKGFKMMN